VEGEFLGVSISKLAKKSSSVVGGMLSSASSLDVDNPKSSWIDSRSLRSTSRSERLLSLSSLIDCVDVVVSVLVMNSSCCIGASEVCCFVEARTCIQCSSCCLLLANCFGL